MTHAADRSAVPQTLLCVRIAAAPNHAAPAAQGTTAKTRTRGSDVARPTAPPNSAPTAALPMPTARVSDEARPKSASGVNDWRAVPPPSGQTTNRLACEEKAEAPVV
jgi:hypothetical protein